MLTIRPPDVYNDLNHSGDVIKAEGILDDKYQKSGTYYLLLSKARISRGDFSKKENFNILIKLEEGRYDFKDLPALGRSVTVSGRKYVFERARNPGQFDMAGYEKCKGVDFELTKAAIIVSSGRKYALREALTTLRYRISRIYDRLFDEEEAGIIKAMVLGDKNALDPQLKGSYQRAGIGHILCISGLHISLIGVFLYNLLKKTGMPRFGAAFISLSTLTLYGMMTGMGVPVKRAVIMFALLILADCIGRSYDLLSALSFSSCLVLLENPYTVYDPAFIMSFGAVTGVGILKPVFDRLFPFENSLLDSLKLSLSVTVFTFPLTLYFYFRTPLYSVILNLAVVPLMGIILIFAILSGFLGFFLMPAAGLTAGVCELILKFYEGVCNINDKLPHSLLIKGRPHYLYIIFYYIVLTLLVFLTERYVGVIKVRSEIIKRAFLLTAFIAVVMVIPVDINQNARITMLDIGQGDCTCIESGKGSVIMIDCGSSDEKEIGRYKVIPFLNSRGRKRIDTAVMTHADNDHISGFIELLTLPEKESAQIGELIMPDTALKDEAYMSLISLAKERGVRVRLISSGDVFEKDGIRFCCLHPESGYECSDRNEYSTVLSVSYKGFYALFTGDVEGRGEEELTERVDHKYKLLKCAHHGSDGSTSKAFLKKVSPDITFISAGRDNSYGHPGKELIKRLKETGSDIFVTKESGALTLVTDGKRIKVTRFLK